MGATLTVTAKGQITLRKEVLEHLGVRPGDRLEVDLLAGRRLQLRPLERKPVSSFFGILARDGTKPLTIEEITRIAEEGWAGKTESGDEGDG